PGLPAIAFAQNVSVPMPMGETIPRPVMTACRGSFMPRVQPPWDSTLDVQVRPVFARDQVSLRGTLSRSDLREESKPVITTRREFFIVAHSSRFQILNGIGAIG